MKYINPVAVTSAALLDCNVLENDEQEWTSSGNYALKERVMSLDTHTIYESSISNNSDNDPDDRANHADKWKKVSATNRWKMFDQKLADPTTNTGSITLEVQPGKIVNAIALFNIHASSVNITVTDSIDGEVYNKTAILVDNSGVTDWYSYFFSPPEKETEIVAFDLPSYSTATISITLSVSQGDVSVGEVVLGAQKHVGSALFGSQIGLTDFSVKERDDFGNAYPVERDFSQNASFDVTMETRTVRHFQREMAKKRATPLVFSGTDDGGYGLLVYGFYEGFYVVLEDALDSHCNLEVEGLI